MLLIMLLLQLLLLPIKSQQWKGAAARKTIQEQENKKAST
jgi:hypothetical protein